ncbi:P0 [Tobacco polerovirus 1]|nr:P0 [Tobacco polerovirus 1]
MFVLTPTGSIAFDETKKLTKLVFVNLVIGFPTLLAQAHILFHYNYEQIYNISRSVFYLLPLLSRCKGWVSSSGLSISRHWHSQCLKWGLLCGTHPAIQIGHTSLTIKIGEPSSAAAYRRELSRIDSSSYVQNARGLYNSWGQDMATFVKNAVCFLEIRKRCYPKRGLNATLDYNFNLVRSLLDACQDTGHLLVDVQYTVLLHNLAVFYNQLDFQGCEILFRELTGLPVYVPGEAYLEGSFLQKELQG